MLFRSEEVQEEVFKRHGVLVPKKELEDLAKALEEAGLLLTEKVEARLKEEEEKLKRERPMRLAGLSYPEGEREARAFLEAFRASYPGEEQVGLAPAEEEGGEGQGQGEGEEGGVGFAASEEEDACGKARQEEEPRVHGEEDAQGGEEASRPPEAEPGA